mmetsp:Transcript_42589/g.120811  ORF Transcript_42589/g.120811 Transcript_42589/m.120811 type:complete len:352 (+) Transcript_42589:136-1191(+)
MEAAGACGGNAGGGSSATRLPGSATHAANNQAVSDRDLLHRMRAGLDLMRDLADTLQTQCVDLSATRDALSGRLSEGLMRIESQVDDMRRIIDSSQVGAGEATGVEGEESDAPDAPHSAHAAVRADGSSVPSFLAATASAVSAAGGWGGASGDLGQGGESEGLQQLQQGVGGLTSEPLCEWTTSCPFFTTKMTSVLPREVEKGPAEMTEGNHHNKIIAPRALNKSGSHSRGRSSFVSPRVVSPSPHDDTSPSGHHNPDDDVQVSVGMPAVCRGRSSSLPPPVLPRSPAPSSAASHQDTPGAQAPVDTFEFLHQMLVQVYAAARMDASQLPNQVSRRPTATLVVHRRWPCAD